MAGKFKVLVSDPLAEKGLALLEAAGDIQVEVQTGLSPEELVARIGAYDALLVRSQTKVTAEVIAAAERLRVIGRAGVGVDNVDVEAATRKGIIVLNAPEGNTISTAEHTLAMLLALARNIPQANASMQEGKWDRKKYTGVELNGKVLGVIGLGRVGTEVARRAQAFNMTVLAYDPFLSEERAQELGVQLATLAEIFPVADFITVHTPLTPETRGLLGAEAIAKMKDGVRLINCARGGIIDEAALVEAIKSGKVAGAAIDVYEEEPPKETPLRGLPQVILTPHLGASTEEAQINVAVDVAREVIKALRGEPFKNAVNIPAVRPEVLAAVQPYLDLAERLGRFAVQLAEGGLNRVELTYSGELAELEVAPLTTAVLKGLLTPVIGDEVNLVNAPYLAKQRGIKILESKAGMPEDYTNLLTIKVQTDQGKHEVAGSLFGRHEARIVRVDGYAVDAIPAGYLLVAPHVDKPGIIGRVGMLLGEAGINIASMQVGRQVRGGDAVMVLGVDNPVPAALLAEISRVEGIKGARLIIV